MLDQTCPICAAPSTCDAPGLPLLQFTCSACSWHHSVRCECGMALRRYTGAGPVDGWLCPSCDEEHASELEVVA